MKTKELTAHDFLSQANIRVCVEILSDGSTAHNLHIGDREFPCYSEEHAWTAAREIAAALKNASNGAI